MGEKKNLADIGAEKFGRSYSLYSSVDSTNNLLKKLCDVLPDGHLAIADEQFSGRGRQGKSFYSPLGEGLYMSLLFKDVKTVTDELFTAKISLAVCRAIDKITGTDNSNGVGIKWVNDIYFGGRKLCGILCERFTSPMGKTCVVAGIGVNLRLKSANVPKDIKTIAASLYDFTGTEYDKYLLCKYICEETEKIFDESFDAEMTISEYKKRSVVIGREITVHRGDERIRAAALDICEDGSLLVRTEDGISGKLRGGEISIRVKK